MRVVVIGGSGFIGGRIVHFLVAGGHDVTLLHRGTRQAEIPGLAGQLRGDRNHLTRFRDRFEALRPDVVLDVIPYTEHQARQLMKTCAGLVDRVVAISSSDVYRNYDGLRGNIYSPPDPMPLAEGAPVRTSLFPYRGDAALERFEYRDDYDKILVERVVLGHADVAGTVLRLPAVYGPGDPQHRFLSTVRRMVDGRPAILLAEGQAEWRWTRGYVDNVAAAVAAATTDARAAGRTYNLGETETPSEREWIERLGVPAAWNGRIVELPADRLPAEMRLPFDWSYHLATDTTRLRRDLEFTDPVSTAEAAERTVEWERSAASSLPPLNYAAEDVAIALAE